jgi:putative ABC transport system permease protein
MMREARGSRGRLAFFTLCLSIGVAAVVAVAGLSASLDDGIRSKARQLLAADLVVGGRSPLPAEVEKALASLPGARRTNVRETVTIVSAPEVKGRPGRSLLVELKAVDGEFPFYGTLTLQPDRPLGALLQGPSAVVAPEVLSRLGLRAGDGLRIGGVDFRIAGMALSEPGKLLEGFVLGPRIFSSGGSFALTGLGGFGSRVEYATLVRLGLGGPTVEQATEQVRKALPDDGRHEARNYVEAFPNLREGMKKAFDFLALGALLSLLVGGIGVAQTVRAWLAGRMDSIANLKCLGMRPREILTLYLGQTAGLGFAGSILGCAAGVFLQSLVPRFAGGLLDIGSGFAWQPAAVLRGLALGIGVALVFSFPPLAQTRRVPPALVLRRGAEPLPGGWWARGASGLVVVAGVFATAWLQSRSLKLAVAFTAAVFTACLVLALAAFLVIRLARRLPRGFTSVALRHGLAALARPGAGTAGAIVSLGLGVLVVLHIHLVQSHLSAWLRAELPREAPSAFLVDIQTDQWPEVKALLEQQGASRIESVPLVTARLSKVDGRDVNELAREGSGDRHRKWALTREQRLTYLEKLPASNKIVEGALWSDPKRAEASLEREFAGELGARLGSTLSLDVQGVPVELAVTSIREVKWESFGINFFVVVEPGVLEKAPQVRVAAARLPEGRDQEIQDLVAARFPNVILLRIRDVLEKIVTILDRVGLGIRVLGGFTALAGIVILGGAVSAGSVRRGREVALRKTLGMTRWGVTAAFAVEYALIGLVAGLFGACGAGLTGWTAVTRWFKIPWHFDGFAFGAAVAGAVALAVLAGLAASMSALRRRPVEVLRGEQ